VAGVVASLEKNIAEADADVIVDDLPAVSGDHTAVEQIFSNLINNALHYLRPEVPGRIRIGGNYKPDQPHCHLWVEDNGEGIPESVRERVFQVFQRAHPERCDGEGMGLSIARRIVERHGGDICLESEVGAGTTFHLTLPSAEFVPPDEDSTQGTSPCLATLESKS
jgi:signal transduction histidine kinase